jgi:hypothetical protein
VKWTNKKVRNQEIQKINHLICPTCHLPCQDDKSPLWVKSNTPAGGMWIWSQGKAKLVFRIQSQMKIEYQPPTLKPFRAVSLCSETLHRKDEDNGECMGKGDACAQNTDWKMVSWVIKEACICCYSTVCVWVLFWSGKWQYIWDGMLR